MRRAPMTVLMLADDELLHWHKDPLGRNVNSDWIWKMQGLRGAEQGRATRTQSPPASVACPHHRRAVGNRLAPEYPERRPMEVLLVRQPARVSREVSHPRARGQDHGTRETRSNSEGQSHDRNRRSPHGSILAVLGDSMGLLVRPITLAALVGFCSCSGVTRNPGLDSLQEVGGPKLVSAIRHEADWHRRQIASGGEGASVELVANHSSWTAGPGALSLLESPLLERSWLSITEFRIDGTGRATGRAGCRRQWIDCTFEGGRELRVFYEDRKGSRILDGWGDGSGRYGYRLDLSEEECQEVLDLSGWGNLETRKVVDGPLPEDDKVLGQLRVHPGVAFRPTLKLEDGEEPPSVLRATRHSLRLREGEAGSDRSDHAGPRQALEATRRHLGEALRGMRWSVLRLAADGEVHPLLREEEPHERIVCHMSNGQVIDLHVYASDGAWCVEGEGSFRLALSAEEGLKLLDHSGWVEPPDGVQ